MSFVRDLFIGVMSSVLALMVVELLRARPQPVAAVRRCQCGKVVA